MSIFTRTFWQAALERAAKSAVQGAITAGIGAAGFDAIHADWQTIGGGALSMAVLSLAMSLGSDAATGGTGPSLTSAETLADTTTVAVTAPADVHVDVQADKPDEAFTCEVCGGHSGSRGNGWDVCAAGHAYASKGGRLDPT